MPTYVTLVNLTDQGIRNIEDTTMRAKALHAVAGQAGVKIKGIYWTMGRYDVVVIAEAPDDETIIRTTVSLGAMGYVRTETLRSFSGPEMDQIIKSSETLRTFLGKADLHIQSMP